MKKIVLYLGVIILLSNMIACDSVSDTDAQLKAQLAEIDDYLKREKIEAYSDPNGIRFSIISLGTEGLPPKRSQTVHINLTGRLFSTQQIFETGEFQVDLSTLVPGLIEGLEILPVGSMAKIFVPSMLGYRDAQNGAIPANSILIYEVELLDVIHSGTEIQQLQEDKEEIDAYLDEKNIEAIIDQTGVRYVVHEMGSGGYATWYDKLKFSYTGKLLDGEVTFYSDSPQPSSSFDNRMVDYLLGLQVGFLNLPAGSKATLYIPSGLAFGPEGAGGGTVPANANVIYELEFLEIVD